MSSNHFAEVRRAVGGVAAEFASARNERAVRRELDVGDFRRLAEAGFLLTGVPVDHGGLWDGLATSVRDFAELIRTLAQGDPCVALVAAMHPSVLSFWLAGEASPEDQAAWRAQREQVIATARDGHWWGTMISEPGSGGDLLLSKARAERIGSDYLLTGEKHFASGAGIASFMITMARVDGAPAPELFVVDMRDRPWDGRAGLTLRAAWNGHGMIATQSHAFTLDRCPARRAASAAAFAAAVPVVSQLTPLLFAAVIIGVLREAVGLAREGMRSRSGLKAYEQVTWVDVTNTAWLAEQAYEGALRSIEAGSTGLLAASRAKVTIATLAERCLGNLARVLGGASYARAAPFGQWAEDVRALGFLRPPWGLAFEQLLRLDLAP